MKFFSNRSLRVRLFSVLGLVIVMLGFASVWGMNQMLKAYQSDIVDSFISTSEGLDGVVESQFYERYGDVQAFALNRNIREMDAKNMTVDIDAYVKLYGIYDLVMVVDRNGQYIASNLKDGQGKAVNTEELRKYQYNEMPWFKAAMNGEFTADKEHGFNGTFFEQFHMDPLLELAYGQERVSLSFSAPIKDSTGKVVGVITNRSNTSWIDSEIKNTYNVISQASGNKTHGIYLVNKDGMLMLGYSPDSLKTEEIKYFIDHGTFKTPLKAQFPNAAQALKDGKSGGHFEVGAETGHDEVVAYAIMNGHKWIPSLGWSIVSNDDATSVLASANEAMRLFFITFGIGVLVAVIVAAWFGFDLSNKIASITEILKKNSGDLSEASSKVASSSTQLSEGSTEQAAALQETVAAVDEISAMVDKNAEAANRSKEASTHSREAATKGRQRVDSMIEAIGEISRSNDDMSVQMENSNQQLAEITRLIGDIGNKTKVINEIVFQTKLLSFNASVEAARAGEYGKGFAVVAEEVGNLAQMSGNAAKEISTLLEESIAKVNSIVTESKSKVDHLMNLSHEKVKLGAETAKECNESLEEILSQVSAVDTLVSEISVASQEQATGIREIAKAVGQMETVTQQNSSVAEASSVAAEQLNSQSVQLNQLVQDLRYIVAGQAQEQAENTKKVISMKKFKEKVSQRKPQKEQTAAATRSEAPAPERVKKVSGDDFMPSSDDPGFEE